VDLRWQVACRHRPHQDGVGIAPTCRLDQTSGKSLPPFPSPTSGFFEASRARPACVTTLHVHVVDTTWVGTIPDNGGVQAEAASKTAAPPKLLG
jgi:hypothetical protein